MNGYWNTIRHVADRYLDDYYDSVSYVEIIELIGFIFDVNEARIHADIQKVIDDEVE